MSESVTALNGIGFDGPVAWVREAPVQGMVTLRGDLSDASLTSAVQQATGCEIPGQRRLLLGDGTAVAWMSPDELLLLLPHADVAAKIAALETALAGQHAMAVDVTDARAVFRIGGPGAREVLARLCPVDLSAAAFAPGEIRRTRMAQIPAAVWVDASGTFTLVCFRSVAGYAFDLLHNAAAHGPVGFYAE
jgi:sarcosine oxidase subunit gamma